MTPAMSLRGNGAAELSGDILPRIGVFWSVFIVRAGAMAEALGKRDVVRQVVECAHGERKTDTPYCYIFVARVSRSWREWTEQRRTSLSDAADTAS